MTTFEGAVFILGFILAILACVRCFLRIRDIDKRIDSILAEEKRQNRRIDVIEQREQLRQVEERYNRDYVKPDDLFSKW